VDARKARMMTAAITWRPGSIGIAPNWILGRLYAWTCVQETRLAKTRRRMLRTRCVTKSGIRELQRPGRARLFTSAS
jgi:hypothetical protein